MGAAQNEGMVQPGPHSWDLTWRRSLNPPPASPRPSARRVPRTALKGAAAFCCSGRTGECWRRSSRRSSTTTRD